MTQDDGAGRSARSTTQWEFWLQDWVGDQTGQPPAQVRTTSTWVELGMGSRELMALAAAVQEESGRKLEAAAAWSHPTLRNLARHLAGESSPSAPSQRRTSQADPAHSDAPMAVVGIGCRFPGAGGGPDAFWELLSSGSDAISEVPDHRWEALGQDPVELRRAGVPRFAGLLEDPFGFDAQHFAISPVEAARMDPQQCMLLEVTSEALQDAGLLPRQLAGRQVGVFVGSSGHEHLSSVIANLDAVDAWTNSGASAAMLANRISYTFDLSGPSMTIDTACSSSLVALHNAVTALRNGECETALVAGVNMLLSPVGALSFEKAGAMAQDGRCKTFDERADGYVRGEGCAVLVVKPLKVALRDGSRIWGVVRGSAVNTNGHSNGLLAPRTSAQKAVMRSALVASGVQPEEVSYVECHGTGTALGDPIEVEALGEAYGRRQDDHPLLIGSVKTNIGHLEGAAGLAGVVKVLLSLSRRELPASLHFKSPNPMVDFSGFEVVTRLRDWPTGSSPLRAGVSSFGFGGSNSHVLLEEAPAYGSNEDPVWVFSGQASRWPGMARELLSEPSFSQMVDRIDPVVAQHCGFSVRELLAEGRLPVGLLQVQPTLFTIQVALARLWTEFGERPAFVIGHSMGEVAAACVAGILSPEDAALLICHRAAAVQKLSGTGSMAVSCASAPRTQEIIEELPQVWVAGHNSPATTLVAGSLEAVEAAEEHLRLAGIATHHVDVDFASHCPLVDPVLDDFRAAINQVELLPGDIPLVSTVSSSHPSEGLDHWMRNLRQPVLFAEAVEEVLDMGVRAFVELSPQPALLESVVETAAAPQGQKAAGPEVTVRPGLIRGVPEDLPSRRRWRRGAQPPPRPARRASSLGLLCGPDHLLGSMVTLPGVGGQRLWRSTTTPEDTATKGVHRVKGRRVIPAWKLLSTVLLATDGRVEGLSFHAPLDAESAQEVLTSVVGNQVTIHCLDKDDSQARLVVCAQVSDGPGNEHDDPPTPPEARDWLPPSDELLAATSGAGQVIGWDRDHEPTGAALHLALSKDPETSLAALLDAACLLPSLASGTAMVPVRVGQAWRQQEAAGTEAVVQGILVDDAWQVQALDPSGRPLLRLDGLVVEDPAEGTHVVQTEVTWVPTSLDTTGATMWSVSATSDTELVIQATELALEAGRRLESLAPGERLIVATTGLHEYSSAAVAPSILWGLAGPFAAEYPDRWGGIIDSPIPSGAHGLEGWSLQMGDLAPLSHPEPLHLTGTETVLVTGATGGIGRQLVRHLAEQGARTMVLITRGNGDESLFAELASLGVSTWVARIDLTRPGALAQWLAEWQVTSGRPIDMVLHLAGHSPDLPVAELQAADLERTLAVKAGALVELLDSCGPNTRGLVFSSAAAIGGVQGQGAYAAANALVDELVRRAAAAGADWRVVNWGPWAGLGMAEGDRAELASEALRSQGWSELQAADGLRALDWALSQHSPQLLVVGGPVSRGGGSKAWSRADAEQRAQLVEEVVRQHLGLSGELSHDRPLAEYGMDSILALRILGGINELAGAELPVAFLWSHPTITTIVTAHELCPAGQSDDTALTAPDPALKVSAFEQLLGEVEDQ